MQDSNGLGKWGSFVAGAAVGALGMYFFDPLKGRRRRALVVDQTVHARKASAREAARLAHRVEGRTQGLYREFMNRRSERTPPHDHVLVERVRAKMGRHVSYPHAITVRAETGVVTLSGLIPGPEIQDLVRSVRSVRGVERVVNQLRIMPRDINMGRAVQEELGRGRRPTEEEVHRGKEDRSGAREIPKQEREWSPALMAEDMAPAGEPNRPGSP